MATITLVTGGARSGKSMFAQKHALSYSGDRIFIATAVAIDREMEMRILKHQEERADQFTTVEVPYDLPAAIRQLTGTTRIACVDCLTVWLGNMLYKYENVTTAIDAAIDELIDTLQTTRCDLVVVTNEVGYGIVPENAMARVFRDYAGTLNRRVAEIADSVYLCVCGIPVPIMKQKG